jgi:hypothetical protein
MKYDDRYPECSKLSAATQELTTITEFLDWCEGKAIHLGVYIDHALHPIPRSANAIIMEHLGIDQEKLETERRAMLAEFKTAHPEYTDEG